MIFSNASSSSFFSCPTRRWYKLIRSFPSAWLLTALLLTSLLPLGGSSCLNLHEAPDRHRPFAMKYLQRRVVFWRFESILLGSSAFEVFSSGAPSLSLESEPLEEVRSSLSVKSGSILRMDGSSEATFVWSASFRDGSCEADVGNADANSSDAATPTAVSGEISPTVPACGRDRSSLQLDGVGELFHIKSELYHLGYACVTYSSGRRRASRFNH